MEAEFEEKAASEYLALEKYRNLARRDVTRFFHRFGLQNSLEFPPWDPPYALVIEVLNCVPCVEAALCEFYNKSTLLS